MRYEEFMAVVEQAFEHLPEQFKNGIENLSVTVEDYPTPEIVALMNLPSKYDLLGLYQGIPLTARGTWYGMSPTAPDRIFLYQKNIEREADGDLEGAIRETLIHEIGHYFGMSEDEIREAGY
jgi:predicted Zn-dependent protease with MMP-like domain